MTRIAFLSALEQTGVIVKACEVAQVGRSTVWKRRQDDKEFARRFLEAEKSAGLLLEAEATRRAVEGQVRKVFNKFSQPIIDPATGQQYEERIYSDRLLELLLKRHFPDLYREKVGTEVHVSSTNNNTRVEFSEERRQQIIARTRELLEADDKAT
jgi:hypothetical protein